MHSMIKAAVVLQLKAVPRLLVGKRYKKPNEAVKQQGIVSMCIQYIHCCGKFGAETLTNTEMLKMLFKHLSGVSSVITLQPCTMHFLTTSQQVVLGSELMKSTQMAFILTINIVICFYFSLINLFKKKIHSSTEIITVKAIPLNNEKERND